MCSPTQETARLVDPSSIFLGLPSELSLQQLDPLLSHQAFVCEKTAHQKDEIIQKR